MFLAEKSDFLKSIDYLWQGMLILFVAMFLLFIAIIILNKIKLK